MLDHHVLATMALSASNIVLLKNVGKMFDSGQESHVTAKISPHVLISRAA